MTSPYVTGPVSTFQGIVGDSRTDPLTNPGFKWGTPGLGGSAAITFSFPTYGAAWHSDYSTYLSNEPYNGFEPFSDAQQQAARQALQSWSNVANITFTEVADTPSDVGDIRFANSQSVTNSTAAAWAYIPYTDSTFTYAESGDIWFDKYYAPNQQLAPGQFGYSTMIHEIGHAIGLDHPFADGAGEPTLPSGQDNQRYSIMSYTTYSGATIEAYGPMLYDILAIQRIYGANMTYHAGDDVYTFQNGGKEYLECIWDAGGHDTIDLSNQTRNQVIDLREGTFSSIGIKNNGQTATGNVGVAFNVTIEDAVGGSGNDKITGNAVANLLKGGGGNDTLDGGDGADTLDGGLNVDAMIGGKGDDTYYVDHASDTISETNTAANGGGVDTVLAWANYSIAAFANVENLVLASGAGNINATGNSATNAVIGNEGSNVIDGGGGVDLLFGGAGNDVYIIDNAGDTVNEQSNTDSHDEIRSASVLFSSFTAGVEDYSYTGSAAWTFTGDAVDNRISGGTNADTLAGAEGNDVLLGNSGNDNLTGGVGDDWLDGGAGNDKLKGGIGNDTYTIDAATDVIDEEGNTDSGDVVRSSMTVTLGSLAGGVIEHAVLTGVAAINATGTGISNKLTGNDGANRLDGGGGADIMDGGKGNDVYVVDEVGDQIVESVAGAAGGTDTIEASLTFSLAPIANVENLTLKSGAVNGTGNALANLITGNDGNNILNGLSGADTLVGGKGDDTYVVNQVGDIITETLSYDLGGGIDLVFAGAGFSIATFANVENLVLSGGAGTANITGNSGANAMIGNAFDNVLDGGGNADLLFGGAGNDTYILDNVGDKADEQSNTDTGDEVRSANILLGAIAGIEHYTYSGSAAWSFTGDTLSNRLSGGSSIDTLDGAGGHDTLLGNNGNDTLIGGTGDDWLDGGAGNDKMFGGAGNDTYTIDTLADVIDEQGNTDSDDTVRSSVTVNLGSLAGGAIEHAALTGAAAINATGNAGANKLTGNDAANTLNGLGGADILDGGKGNDIYVVDEAGDQVIENLAGVTGGTDTVQSAIDFSLAALANVENLTLTGSAANAVGNGLVNVLTGNDGNNILNGGSGADTLIGNKGDDTYVVDNAGDVISETIAVGGGVDTVLSNLNYSVAGFANVENLILLGGAGNINATGNALANALIGNEGNNKLDGGSGADVLLGGAGNDVYVFDNAGDAADEQANTDTDDEVRSANILLGAIAGIEHYTYTGSAVWNFTGNALDNKVSGGTGNDTLNGADGNDTLKGNNGNDTLIGGIGDDWLEGGAGNDKLKGGVGNDTYVVTDAGDTIDEEGNTDTGDTIQASLSINLTTLVGGGAIEIVKLTGVSNLNITGNTLANTLYGNDGTNTLDGGSGADTLYGGLGSDTYLFDNVGDVAAETAGGGTDLIISSASVDLSAQPYVENVTLNGTSNTNATGNSEANVLTGNDGNNVLDGSGGSDTLIGGKGDDTYVIDSVGDVIVENGGGNDTVVSSIFFSIDGSLILENLTITGTIDYQVIGNNLSNILIGNSGDNNIVGRDGTDKLFGNAGADILQGGAGDDYLNGGDGTDQFYTEAGRDTIDYDHVSELGDTIYDFTAGKGGDVLDLHDLLVDVGYSGSDAFADGYLSLTSSVTTTLWLDADGAGAGGKVQIAQLVSTTLNASDTDNFIL